MNGVWLNGGYFEGQLNVSAKSQVVLSSGFSVSPNSSFTAKIDNDLWCCPKSLPIEILDPTNQDNESFDSSEKWEIYPNPTSEKLFFKTNTLLPTQGGYTIVIMDGLGRGCREFAISSIYGEIDLSEVEKGTYIVVIKNKNGEVSAKEILLVW